MTNAKPGIGPGPDLASLATTVGAIAIGAAFFEAALIPGIVLGAAAILAPELTSRSLPKVRRGLQSLFQQPAAGPKAVINPKPLPQRFPISILPHLQIGQALAKTITFRITIATLDFAWNYIIIGDLTTAAGLSALNLTVGPMFYFLHESIWNFYSSPGLRGSGFALADVAVLPPEQPGATSPDVRVGGIKITRALAKTVVYETMGTVAEFTVNFLVVGDAVTAAIITAPLVIFGPFIYYGHEKAWDYYSARAKRTPRAA